MSQLTTQLTTREGHVAVSWLEDVETHPRRLVASPSLEGKKGAASDCGLSCVA